MNRQKAAEIIGYSRRRSKAIGCMIWPVMLGIGFTGWYLWKWYTLLIAVAIAFVFGTIYSIFETKRIQRLTGMNIHEQEIAFRESAAANLDPVTRNPEQYKSYIDTLSDDEDDEDENDED